MKLEWTEPAVADLEGIREHIAKDSELYASIFLEKIIGAVENLSIFPYMGRVVSESKKKNIREIIVSPYRIIYRIEKERILVLAVVHSARDLRRRPRPWEIS